MRIALVLEIEELLFDTRRVRAAALRESLASQGIDVDSDGVTVAHTGVPAPLALERVTVARALDPTARELVLHGAAALASRELSLHAPAFDTAVRDHLISLAAEAPVAVVTRATLEQAQHWLALAALEGAVAAVRTLDGREPEAYAVAWRDVVHRVHARQGVAIASPPLLAAAARAGLRTVHIGPPYDRDTAGYHPDAQLASLSQVDAAFMAGLFAEPHVIHPVP